MKTTEEFLEEYKDRKRCGGQPHKQFLKKLTERQVRKLMRAVMSWKDSDNPRIQGHYRDYTPYLKMRVVDLPEEILYKMYGNSYVLEGEDGRYLYQPCCR
jgi:hypothetical protein